MWQPNKEKKEPLYQQIMTHLIQQIQMGELTPGESLLAERKLAERYQVNRSTVVRALEELASLGWLLRIHGSGTIIAERHPEHSPIPSPFIRLLGRSHFQEDTYTTAIKEQLTDEKTLDGFTGDLPLELIPDFHFPSISWEKLILEEKKKTAVGYEPLKTFIQQKLATEMQQPQTNQKVLITSGSTQGLILLLQNLLQQGDVLATEENSFLFSLPIFAPLGIRCIGIKQDHLGIDCQELEKKILQGRIRALYLNPNYQNPTSLTMSLQRRQEILALCQKYAIPIIEDDIFADLNTQMRAPSLKELAPEQVIYLGSFSKLFSSRIKIGWIYASPQLINQLTLTKLQTEQETELFPQLLATSALTAPDYQKKHQQLLEELKKRQQTFEQGFQAFAADWHCLPIQGGLYYWITWKHGNLKRKDWDLFLEEKVAIAPSFLFGQTTNHFRLNYTRLNETDQACFFEKLQRITKKIKQKKREKGF
ncbi:aminotransferase-like domain-containing protein [Enterococcus sp. LJL98]